MMKKFGWLAGLVILLTLSACAPKNVVVLLPDPDGSVGKVAISNPGGSQTLDKAGQATYIDDRNKSPQAPVVMEQDEIQRRFGPALAARPLAPVYFRLYFHSNATDLVDASRAILPDILKAIKERGSVDISVVGHSDTVGKDAYNIKLSRQRAEAVAKWLMEMKVDPKSLEITSHGKRRLLIPTGDNVDEPRNRRVEVTVR